MASAQCCKPAEQTCNQGQQNHSLGQKVSDLVTSVFKKDQTHQGHTTSHCPTQCSSHTTEHKTQTVCVGQTNGHEAHDQGLGHANSNGAKCNSKSRRGERKKRGLLQKIKDGISGHSDSGSSSSESDSDDDKCGKNKN
ncbi:hypothetical protein P3X46_016818 [Hevea brasiliensis]|uniref:Uncharacterized protein n=1 Tax=Hevea brasiliensis TaxID=3981 RepID=A0ABQ9M4A2_HEVBR|nr:uncharacterized protein LOC110671533 [Hevea brasiliensis]KAJ9173708.1 hypothetical protein P3X46_016818 [Hevea brasiliensis]